MTRRAIVVADGSELRRAGRAAGARRNKYHAERTTYGGQTYDSRTEAEYAAELDRQQAAGLIAGWRRGGRRTILEYTDWRGKKVTITHKPDFEVWRHPDRSDRFIVDAKGVLTREAARLIKIWNWVYPTLPYYTARKSGSGWKVERV